MLDIILDSLMSKQNSLKEINRSLGKLCVCVCVCMGDGEDAFTPFSMLTVFRETRNVLSCSFCEVS